MGFSAAQGLALVRFGVGMYFLAQAYDKLARGWLASGRPLGQFIRAQIPQTDPLYRGFVEGVVLPNAGTVAQFVALGEAVVGLSLALGLLTRLGSLLGMWLVLNMMLLKGLAQLAGTNDRLVFVACAAFLLASAGQVWGLDGMLQRTLARIPFVRWFAEAGDRAGRPRMAPAY